jgi:hypothetical protein
LGEQPESVRETAGRKADRVDNASLLVGK